MEFATPTVLILKSKPDSESSESDSISESEPICNPQVPNSSAPVPFALLKRETPESKEERRLRLRRAAVRRRRLNEASEDRYERRRRLQRQSQRRRRENQTPEERAERRRKETLQKAKRRENQTPEEREGIRRKAALQKAKERAANSNRQKKTQTQNTRKTRNETPEEQVERLRKNREKYAMRLVRETPEERNERLRRARKLRIARGIQGNPEKCAVERCAVTWNNLEEAEECVKVNRDVRLLRMKFETEEQRRERHRNAQTKKKLPGIKGHAQLAALENHDFYCEICSTIILKRSRYVRHLRYHMRASGLQLIENEPIHFYICDFDECQLCFRDKPRFITHLESHSAARVTFDCPLCQKRFSKEIHCQNHLELVHGTNSDTSNNMDCPYCHQVVLDKENDWENQVWSHQIRLNENIPPGNHLCENCGKTFKKASSLNAHVKRHGKPSQLDRTYNRALNIRRKPCKEVPCTICHSKLTGMKQLHNHMLNCHTYEHGLTCYVCNKPFKYLHFLTAHIRTTHTRQPNISRRAKCKFCDKDFSCYAMKDKHHFYAHRDEYLKVKKYCCTICYRSFASPDVLKTHLPLHDRLICSVCGIYQFSPAALETHQQIHNPDLRHRGGGTSRKPRKHKYTSDSSGVDIWEKELEDLEERPEKYFYHSGVGYVKREDIDQMESEEPDRRVEDPSSSIFAASGQFTAFMPSTLGNQHNAEDADVLLEFDVKFQGGSNDAETIPTSTSSATQEKKYQCDRCPQQFQYPKPLLIHISWHIGEDTRTVYPVNIIIDSVVPVKQDSTELQKYLNPNYVEAEVQVQEPSQTECHAYECPEPECAEAFTSQIHLNTHRRVKHGIFMKTDQQASYKCNFCLNDFSTEYRLKWHTAHYHEDNLEAAQGATSSSENMKIFDKETQSPRAPKSRSEKTIERITNKQIMITNPHSKRKRTEFIAGKSLANKKVARRDPGRFLFQCDLCHYASSRETALQQHKQLAHDHVPEAEAPEDDEDEESEFVLPDIKEEPVDDLDWDFTGHEHEEDIDWSPVFSSEVCYQDDHVIQSEKSASITELKMRVAELSACLCPNLQTMAEAFPFAYVPLTRIQVPAHIAVQSSETHFKSSKTKALRTKGRLQMRKGTRRPTRKPKFKKSRSESDSKSDSDATTPEKGNSNERIKITCEVCAKQFTVARYRQSRVMSEHMATHSGTKSFKCTESRCTRAFYNSTQLKQHLRKLHGIRKTKPRLESSTKSWSLYGANYYCDLCRRTLKYKTRYDRHMRTHADVDSSLKGVVYVYHCDDCQMGYRVKDLFLRHLESHGAKGPNLAAVCSVCSKSFAKLETLERHTTLVHETKGAVYDCGYCHRSFKNEANLSEHELAHRLDLSVKVEGEHMCSHCGQQFKQLNCLNAHIFRVHEDVGLDPGTKPSTNERKGRVYSRKRESCQVCGETVCDNFLDNHMLREHTYEHGLYCFVCDEKFTWIRNLDRHIAEVHKDTEEETRFQINVQVASRRRTKKKFYCEFCTDSLKTAYCRSGLDGHQFMNHREFYLKEKPFYCQTCFKNFATEEELSLHSHKRESKVHLCPQCGEQFKRKVYLTVHMLKHGEGERRHQCSICDKKFTTIFNLRDHERRHLKKYTCFCPYCPENTVGFHRKVHLNQHVAKAHGSHESGLQHAAQNENENIENSINFEPDSEDSGTNDPEMEKRSVGQTIGIPYNDRQLGPVAGTGAGASCNYSMQYLEAQCPPQQYT